MRRALQTLEPRENPDASEEERRLVRNAVLRGWYALRERFLEELDLELRTNRFSFPALSGPSRPALHAWHGPRWRPNASSR